MKNIKAGTARVTTGAHYGWKDWLAQRITGAMILIWVLAMLVRFLVASDLSFAGWHAFMGGAVMKTLTIFTVLAAAYHAWIGVRDIWMDYVQSVGMRLLLQVLTIIWLVGCAGWLLQVLWRL